MKREDVRKLIHLATTGFAFTLPWIPPWMRYGACASAILLWWVVLPAMGRDRGLTRENETYVNGLKTYPIAILLLLLLFPLDVAAAGWGVLGVGDAFSNLVGRRMGRQGLLGRPDRSLAGTVAFVVTAIPAAWGLAVYVGPIDARTAWGPAVAAGLAGAAAELLPMPLPLEDNLPGAIAAAAAFAAAAA